MWRRDGLTRPTYVVVHPSPFQLSTRSNILLLVQLLVVFGESCSLRPNCSTSRSLSALTHASSIPLPRVDV